MVRPRGLRVTSFPESGRSAPAATGARICSSAKSSQSSFDALRLYRQQLRSDCLGGQGMSPYEQNTQQSPDSGFSIAPQDGQSQKNRQASVGMSARVAVPHPGHVIVLSSTGARCDLSIGLSAMVRTMRPLYSCVVGVRGAQEATRQVSFSQKHMMRGINPDSMCVGQHICQEVVPDRSTPE